MDTETQTHTDNRWSSEEGGRNWKDTATAKGGLQPSEVRNSLQIEHDTADIGISDFHPSEG